MGNHCYIFVFLKEKVEYIELLLQIRQKPLLNLVLLVHITPPLKPILPHYRQQFLYRLSASLLALASFNLFEDVLFVLLVECVDVPGLPIFHPVKIEMREHTH